MDIEQYLTERKRRFDSGASRIRRFEVFDFNYVPEKPLMREEVKPVIDALLRYQQTGIANNILILGSRGSGKSVLARYLMKPCRRKPVHVGLRQLPPAQYQLQDPGLLAGRAAPGLQPG